MADPENRRRRSELGDEWQETALEPQPEKTKTPRRNWQCWENTLMALFLAVVLIVPLTLNLRRTLRFF